MHFLKDLPMLPTESLAELAVTQQSHRAAGGSN
jgi:hypothetical protein